MSNMMSTEQSLVMLYENHSLILIVSTTFIIFFIIRVFLL